MENGQRSGFERKRMTGQLFLVLCLVMLVSGCAGRSDRAAQGTQVLSVRTTPASSLTETFSPSFVLQGAAAPHNRIGRVDAVGRDGRGEVRITTDQPVVYAGMFPFATPKDRYINLVYRVHFPEIPFSLIPFYLGAGDNVGLLVILTLDAQHRLLLVTTANTCGCYAVTIPTETLSPDVYPDNWPKTSLTVYGETLPARLPLMQEQEQLQVVVRADVHRVMDLRMVPKEIPAPGTAQEVAFDAIDTLKRLPLTDGTYTSMYYQQWPLTGHVKGAIKPWESLFLSLVSLDFFVGMDKEYDGSPGSQLRANPFYTSLKPWNRRASDMNDFAAYLLFNGWNL
jgi:hypothetical protein